MKIKSSLIARQLNNERGYWLSAFPEKLSNLGFNDAAACFLAARARAQMTQFGERNTLV